MKAPGFPKVFRLAMSRNNRVKAVAVPVNTAHVSVGGLYVVQTLVGVILQKLRKNRSKPAVEPSLSSLDCSPCTMGRS